MKNPTSRLLHAYWDRLRGARAAPERGEIEPGEIRTLLADSLVLEIAPADRHAVLRLAGTRVCALFGRELRGAAFADLWGGGGAAWGLVETVAVDTVGLVAGLHGTTERGEGVDLELLLLPLRHRGRTQARMLGALSPTVIPPWLGTRPLTRFETVSSRVLGADAAVAEDAPPVHLPPDLPPPANDAAPVRRGHLLIHQGGRA